MGIDLDIPPGLVSDDTTFSSTGPYEDAANMRFWRGRPQTIGGRGAVTSDTLKGKCRGLLSWADNAGNVTLGLGRHSVLYAYQGGTLANITPTGLAAGMRTALGGQAMALRATAPALTAHRAPTTIREPGRSTPIRGNRLALHIEA
jgi:hypothetical protein